MRVMITKSTMITMCSMFTLTDCQYRRKKFALLASSAVKKSFTVTFG
jgi:hypothetical protein